MLGLLMLGYVLLLPADTSGRREAAAPRAAQRGAVLALRRRGLGVRRGAALCGAEREAMTGQRPSRRQCSSIRAPACRRGSGSGCRGARRVGGAGRARLVLRRAHLHVDDASAGGAAWRLARSASSLSRVSRVGVAGRRGGTGRRRRRRSAGIEAMGPRGVPWRSSASLVSAVVPPRHRLGGLAPVLHRPLRGDAMKPRAHRDWRWWLLAAGDRLPGIGQDDGGVATA